MSDLREDGCHLASYVAVEDDRVVAHALYSRMYVDTNRGSEGVVALGPIGVFPDRQRSGLGSAVILAGLEAVSAQGERFILVLGNPVHRIQSS
ncbi:MAG: GNAT family N-acetyltransferase [Myxococcota bacterium]|nr:GNAT family N-acetyltransferase [Myxococcota bacterium]